MYFRHLYATVQPTLEQRSDSYDNYCALFNVILQSNVNMVVCFYVSFLQSYVNMVICFLCQYQVRTCPWW